MPSPRRSPGRLLQETREHRSLMNYYERFGHVVAFILSVIIALVIALALLKLLTRVVPLLVTGSIHPLDHEVFEGLFGMIMTLLIALEFKHSIIRRCGRLSQMVHLLPWQALQLPLRRLPRGVIFACQTFADFFDAHRCGSLSGGRHSPSSNHHDQRQPSENATLPNAFNHR